jgi:hypothetical protein
MSEEKSNPMRDALLKSYRELLKNETFDSPEYMIALFMAATEKFIDHMIDENNLSNVKLLDTLRVATTRAQRYGFEYIQDRIQKVVDKIVAEEADAKE